MSMSITSSVAGSGTNSITSNQARQYSTLPRKLHGSGKLQAQPPPPPKRDPNTTLSVGKARAKSMVANLAAIGKRDLFIDVKFSNCFSYYASQFIYFTKHNYTFSEALDKAISEHDFGTNHALTDAGDPSQRKSSLMDSSKFPLGDLIDLNNSDRSKNKVYASVAEMKRSKVGSLG